MIGLIRTMTAKGYTFFEGFKCWNALVPTYEISFSTSYGGRGEWVEIAIGDTHSEIKHKVTGLDITVNGK